MKAVVYRSYGGPEVLELADVPEPSAGPGQVRIRVQAAGVNPYDWKLRAGLYAGGQPLAKPVIPGREAAGIVDQVGEGVTGVAVGDAVFGLGKATSAEYAVLTAWAPQPHHANFVQAAGMALVAETALRVLRELHVTPGQTVLIHGAAGGVGQAAVQLARQLGATVIGTAGERNHELLTMLGATPVAYGPGMVERVREAAPHGVDAVFDAHGSALDDLLAIAGGPERIVTIANFAAADAGVTVSRGGQPALDALPLVAQLADEGRFTLRVAATFGLSGAAEAHELSASGGANGKIVLLVG